MARKFRARRLQTRDSKTEVAGRVSNHTKSISSNTKDSDTYYGTAYQDYYEGGFYYGDLQIDDDALPACYPEDKECQSASEKRETAHLALAVTVVVVIILGVLICKCCIKREVKSNE